MPTVIVRKPVISEKSVALAGEKNIYLFEVNPLANKHQITAEVERMYGVSVESVRTVMMPQKKRRTGRKRLVRLSAARKKAFVHVKVGQKIAVFDMVQN